jgi:hypothetical protein
MTALSDKVATYAANVPDWQIADDLNAPDVNLPFVYCDVATADAREIMLATGGWAAIITASTNANIPTELRDACILARDTLTLTNNIRTSDAAIRMAVNIALGGLVLAGIITQGTLDAVSSLMKRHPSWAEANGVKVDARAVGLARGGI